MVWFGHDLWQLHWNRQITTVLHGGKNTDRLVVDHVFFAHDVGIGITWFYDNIIFISFEIHGNGVYNCTI